MLSPPISQIDIDNKTVFLTRGGGTARVTHRYDTVHPCQWHVQYSEDVLIPWVTDKGFWHSGDSIESPADLISRLEQPMESQVVYEDARKEPGTSEFVSFGRLKLGDLFEYDREIFRKINKFSSDNCERIAGPLQKGFCSFTDDNTQVRLVPNLRLRLVLESKP